jgi:hypothetical protein
LPIFHCQLPIVACGVKAPPRSRRLR